MNVKKLTFQEIQTILSYLTANIGRNLKNIFLTGSELYIHLLLSLRNSACDIQNIQVS